MIEKISQSRTEATENGRRPAMKGSNNSSNACRNVQMSTKIKRKLLYNRNRLKENKYIFIVFYWTFGQKAPNKR